MTRHDLVVVGAGAMGTAVAWHAARLGLDRVLLVDRAGACSGTSARGAGVVNRLLWNPLDIALATRAIGWLRELDAWSQGAFTYHDVGGLMLVDAARVPDARRSLRLWRAQGLAVAELDASDVHELPGCDVFTLADDERGYLTEGDGWCVTTDAVSAMNREARDHGVEVRTGAPVARVEPGAVTLEGGERLDADDVVVAAGAWSGTLLAGTWRAPLASYRPQAAALTVVHDECMPTVHDVAYGTYWRSEGPGKLVVGNGTVLAPQDPSGEPPVEPTFAPALVEKLARRWPKARGARLVRAWAGFEAGTPDRRPLAGPVPGLEGVHMLAGGNGFGFMRAAALGEAMAHAILGMDAPVPIKEYEPARFAGTGEAFALREGFSLG